MIAKRFMICAIMLLVSFPASSFGYTVLGYFHKTQYGPGGLAYDEATDTLWASDLIAKKLLKINPSNGAVLTTLNVGYNSLPVGLTFKDGYLWNSDQWAVPEVIHKVNPANGSSLGSIPGLGGLTFDNLGRLWSSNWDIELRALNPNNGAILDTITLPGFNPSYDQILGLAFDSNTEKLWVSVVENRWGGGSITNHLLSVTLDGTVQSSEEFDPNPALNGYELCGLAFDDNSNTLWANYSLFDRPPTWDDTYILKLSTGGPLICECELSPDTTTTLSRGETLGFWASVTNNTDNPGRVSFATNVTLPSLQKTRFMEGPVSVSLDPYQSKSGHISHTVPIGAPLGHYIYHGYVGIPSLYNVCQFEFDVIE